MVLLLGETLVFGEDIFLGYLAVYWTGHFWALLSTFEHLKYEFFR